MHGCMDICFQWLNACKLKGRAVKRSHYSHLYTNRHIESIDDLVNKFIDDSLVKGWISGFMNGCK